MATSDKTLLVVEDEAIIAEDIRETLTRIGYSVPEIVDSGVEAVDAVERLRPRLVLMDIKLRGPLDGIGAAVIIRKRFGIPVVFLTSHSDEATLARAMGSEPYGFLLKPYADRDLRTAIEVALTRHELEFKLEQRTALLEAVLGSMEEAVVARDAEGRLLIANEAALQAMGSDVEPPEELVVLLPDQETPCPTDAIPLARAMRGETVREAELFVRSAQHPEGRWLSTNAGPMLDARGTIRGGVAVSRDVTELKAMQLELRRMSIVDELTGLYNRRGFQMLAQQQLKIAKRTRRFPCMVFVDLNEMKKINDELGHDVGDAALQEAARVLKRTFRDSDIVARLGGDEFVVMAVDVGTREDALRSRLFANVDAANATGQQRFRLSMSVGICACDPDEPASIEELIARADKSMYEQKQLRRMHGSGAMRAVNGTRKKAPAR